MKTEMKKTRFLFKIFLFFIFCSAVYAKHSPLLKTGDIVFAKYNDYFDYGITAFLHSKYSHTLIKTPEGLFSFTIMFIGDKGRIYVDQNLYKDKKKVLVLRPVMSKEQYSVYRKCVENYTGILDDKVSKGEILFDWDFKNRKNAFVCNTFIFHILMKCLPDYKQYFKIKNPDKIHYDKNGNPVIYFDNALNLRKFKTIIKY